MYTENLLITIILGAFGGHYFYHKNWKKGIIYFFTMGLLGIGWVYDIYRAIVGRFYEFDNNNFTSFEKSNMKTLMKMKDIEKLNNNELPLIENHNLMLDKDEVCVFMDKAFTKKTKTRVTGYKTESSGLSIRLSKNLSVGSRGGTTKAVRQAYNEYNFGTLYVTNKRIIFSSDDFSFDKNLNQITSLNDNGQSIELQIGAKTYNLSMKLSKEFCKLIDNINK